jgi:hypothetical protein
VSIPPPIDGHVTPGVICRIYVDAGLSYVTRRMTLEDARRVAAGVYAAMDQGSVRVGFPSACHEELSVRATAIRAVEVARVDGVGRVASGQIHLDRSGDQAVSLGAAR